MTFYEIIIACVALSNLLLTLLSLRASHTKAATARLDSMEASLKTRLDGHDDELANQAALLKTTITYEHLADVYREIKDLAEQVHTMLGEQRQITQLLRQLLSQQLR
ncbi:hypothetical protein LNV08_11770 [Paucibacter sp. TC2R-5]|uniref:hypothetical protein n=1 Tax=Paucibacter sp. TC2R-5 TaxID=2893555 RepID=UPI0021E407DD|nr:hypothetical protein [Paucibacter sp. TC2R-5]MCV2359647.1 hypothetical protein [Paucibacter sp. TC2R-5]